MGSSSSRVVYHQRTRSWEAEFRHEGAPNEWDEGPALAVTIVASHATNVGPWLVTLLPGPDLLDERQL